MKTVTELLADLAGGIKALAGHARVPRVSPPDRPQGGTTGLV